MNHRKLLVLTLVFALALAVGAYAPQSAAVPPPQEDPAEQCWLAEIQAYDVYGNLVYYGDYVGTTSSGCSSTISSLIAFAQAQGSTYIPGTSRCFASKWCALPG